MKPKDEEKLVSLLFHAIYFPFISYGYHVTHLRGVLPIFLCRICGKMKEEGVLARARKRDNHSKLEPKGHFVCQDCLTRAASGRVKP